MIALVGVLVVVLWLLVAVLAAVALGMTIAAADRPTSRKSCCPHPLADAPETVRGEFRALPLRPVEPGSRLDVRL